MIKYLFCIVLTFANVDIYDAQLSCGRPIGGTHKARVVGGYDIGYYKYPWFAALLMDDVLYCGGTLITNKHILTAAHCFSDYITAASFGQLRLEDVYQAKLGVYNNCKAETTQREFNISQVFVHELYVKNQPYYDIALITLDTENCGFEPCCLPNKVYQSDTRPPDGFILGLGNLEYESALITCTVREAKLLIYSDQICRDMLNSMENNGSALTGAFCAGYLKGGVDACQGDSGGPLTISGPDSHLSLLGITSFGFGCADKNLLGVYTDVSHYLDWIHEKINNHTLPPPKEDIAPSNPAPVVELPDDTPVSYQSVISNKNPISTTQSPTPDLLNENYQKRHKHIKMRNHKTKSRLVKKNKNGQH